MSHGGLRQGSGRKKGSLTTKTREIADKASVEGMTPLEYMLKILRNEQASPVDRFEAAKAAAPYIHPRLAAVEHSGGLKLSHEEALAQLVEIADEQAGDSDTTEA